MNHDLEFNSSRFQQALETLDLLFGNWHVRGTSSAGPAPEIVGVRLINALDDAESFVSRVSENAKDLVPKGREIL